MNTQFQLLRELKYFYFSLLFIYLPLRGTVSETFNAGPFTFEILFHNWSEDVFISPLFFTGAIVSGLVSPNEGT